LEEHITCKVEEKAKQNPPEAGGKLISNLSPASVYFMLGIVCC
jgi:hypothetical protein